MNYHTVGLETRYLLLNLGSLGVMILLYPCIYIYYYLIKFCACSRKCRYHKKNLASQIFWNTLLRLLIESYMIGVLCSCVNVGIASFDFANSTLWQNINSVLTYLLIITFTIFPVYTIRFLSKNFTKLRSKAVN